VLAMAVTSWGKDHCECLKWKQVYASQRVFCGEGLEFNVFEGALGYDLPGIKYIQTNFKGVYDEFCTTFFEKLDTNLCVNVGMYAYGTPGLHGAQWCYVPRECTQLNGGVPVADKKALKTTGWLSSPAPEPLPRDVSWKVCVPQRDRRLRDLEVPELLELARSMGAQTGYVTKVAYPRLVPPNHTWASVEAAVARGDVAGMPPELRAAMAERVPIVVDVDPDGHGHQKIIWGKEVYHLSNTSGWPHHRGKDVGEL